MPDEFDELATLEAEKDLLVLFEDVGIVCVGVLKRLVNITLKNGSSDA